MAVSAEEQAKRAGSVVGYGLGVFLAIPLLGDLIGLFVVVGPLYGATLIKSERRATDLLILTGLFFLFFMCLFFGGLGYKVDRSLEGLGWILAYVSRFLIATKGLAWYLRRLEGQTDGRPEVGQ